MPIQFPDFGRINFNEANPFLTGATIGAENMRQAINFPNLLQEQILKNQLAQIEAKYGEPKTLADIAYKQAMAQYLTNPNQLLKGLTNVGKSYVEPFIINRLTGKMEPNPDYNPGAASQNNQPINNYNQTSNADAQGQPQNNTLDNNDVNSRYELYRGKLTTDTQARNRNLFATNIEKTLNYIDPNVIGQYGGIEGSLKRLSEKAKSGYGKESKEYDDFLQQQQAIKLLVEQVRQFYGSSIQPEMAAKLESLANSADWFTNPKQAVKNFNEFKSILQNELDTYRQAYKSPKAYESAESYTPSQPQTGNGYLPGGGFTPESMPGGVPLDEAQIKALQDAKGRFKGLDIQTPNQVPRRRYNPMTGRVE